jgi:hypothetical protein
VSIVFHVEYASYISPAVLSVNLEMSNLHDATVILDDSPNFL